MAFELTTGQYSNKGHKCQYKKLADLSRSHVDRSDDWFFLIHDLDICQNTLNIPGKMHILSLTWLSREQWLFK